MADKHPGGRPTKYSKENLLAVEIMARHGYTNADMAEKLKINRDTFQEWINKYPEFSDTLTKAKESPDDMVEAALFRRATGMTLKTQKVLTVAQGSGQGSEVEIVHYEETYAPDPTSMIFYLKNRRPDKWREKQDIEHSGGITTTSLTKEEREAEIELLLAKKKASGSGYKN